MTSHCAARRAGGAQASDFSSTGRCRTGRRILAGNYSLRPVNSTSEKQNIRITPAFLALANVNESLRCPSLLRTHALLKWNVGCFDNGHPTPR
jgi:hypothetical protein